jgi:hypothetical protein
LTEGTYLGRWKLREAYRKQKAQAVFGIAGGFILSCLFGFRAFYVTEASTWPNAGVSVVGAIMLLTALARPSAVEAILSPLQKIGNRVGGFLLSAFIAAIYFLIMTPVGELYRRTRGAHPFYSWDTAPPQAGIEGWTEKPSAETEIKDGSRWKWTAPFRLVNMIVQRRNFILLPVLLILVMLGMTMFFVHSTGIAPLIYTLF